MKTPTNELRRNMFGLGARTFTGGCSRLLLTESQPSYKSIQF